MTQFKVLLPRQDVTEFDLQIWAQKIVGQLSDKTVLLLSGDVGAGKTTLVRALAQLLKLKDIASPSFAIHHRYENAAGIAMDHVDLYRLKSLDDLESTGFWDLFQQEKGLIVVEWANLLNPEILPMDWKTIEVYLHQKDDRRSYEAMEIIREI
ncbi:MAG: tRNA (adenosine(37)-N6)-threonylcarbamoyltransferase complex ATPase subunit type 1 TsaE [Bdellovibrionota bacterium]